MTKKPKQDPTEQTIVTKVEKMPTEAEKKAYILFLSGPLVGKLQQLKEEEEAKKYSGERKEQIGSGDRSEKIRTYNFPQDRITDHRIGKSWHNMEKILDGNIEPMIETLIKEQNKTK